MLDGNLEILQPVRSGLAAREARLGALTDFRVTGGDARGARLPEGHAWKSLPGPDAVFAHDLAPDTCLFCEECAERRGVDKQQGHLLRIAQLSRHGRLAQDLLEALIVLALVRW